MNEKQKGHEKRMEDIKESISKINHKIAVMSGKGGVGKTTVSVNLAAWLAKQNETAILDADVDCPNVNDFLGIDERFSVKENKIIPTKKFGMKVVSFASLQEKKDEPTIWRGPMLSKALKEILVKTEWGSLDYLVVDLPPGTSDAPLTIMQAIEPDGIVVVATPQRASITDAKKSAKMAEKLEVPVIGVVENMSGEIFGEGAGKKAADELGVDFLGRIELDERIPQACEKGKPFVLEDSDLSQGFGSIADKIKEKEL